MNNPATGRPLFAHQWESQFTEEERKRIKDLRGIKAPGLYVKLVLLLDALTATQGGQLAFSSLEEHGSCRRGGTGSVT